MNDAEIKAENGAPPVPTADENETAASTPGRILSEAELTELADKMRYPGIKPFTLLTWLAAKFLAARFPDKAEGIESGKHGKVIDEFAKGLLRKNGYAYTLPYNLGEQSQIAGIEPLLFAKADDSLIADAEYEFCHCCPECGGTNIERNNACPGYMMPDGLYRCSPPSACGNATEFKCTDCYWSWQTPLHEKSSWYAENEAKRPPWADDVI